MTRVRLPAGLLVISLASGCAGNGEGLDQNGRPGGTTGLLAPTIESIQDHVFTPRCVECHAGANAPQGLRLEDAQTSYDHLVNVFSSQSPTLFRVEPGDPDNSYLVHKLEGTQSVGNRMPNGRPPLPAETIAVIRQWIADGAAAPVSTAKAQALFLPAVELQPVPAMPVGP